MKSESEQGGSKSAGKCIAQHGQAAAGATAAELERLLQQLYLRRRFGMQPGLERMVALLEQLGNPQQEWLALHIAGTNGKGSVAALAASMLQGAGLGRIGRFTSPHLLYFNERITIDGVPLSDAELLPLLQAVLTASAAVAARLGQEPTFFECVAAVAFEHFRRAGVQMAVVETGLGGRLDATNTVMSLVSVITSIGLEHCEYLGHTLAAVAAEKAGIIRKGCPVVIGSLAAEAEAEIVGVALAREARLIKAAEEVGVVVRRQGLAGSDVELATGRSSVGRLHLPLAGSFQIENLAVAVAAVETLLERVGISLTDQALKAGVAACRWPGRFQLVKEEPPVVVDGAHNPAAAARLREALRRAGAPQQVALVAGFCDDKDVAGILAHLAPAVARGWAVATPSSRTMSPAMAAAAMRQAGIAVVEPRPLEESLAAAEQWALAAGGMVVVCGSLFLVGRVLQHYAAYPWSSDRESSDPNELLRAEGERQ